MDMARRIKRLRIHLKWTQAALGDALGVPQQAVSAWERGIAKPTKPVLRQLTRVFGISSEALLKGKGFKLPDLPLRWAVGVDERDLNRQVPLPPPVPGEIWEVSLTSADRQSIPVEEAIALLRRAAKDGQAVWVVVEK
ncbi:MAG: helix-turn-helix transcriptional regulator [Bdellovibrionales bacterium]|nr:helix-turn-helix transcriptional regulator [Bdellovibrionales bacterium]